MDEHYGLVKLSYSDGSRGGGGLTARLKKEVQALKELNQSLQESKAKSEQNDRVLRDHAEKLEMWLTTLAKWI